MARRGSLLDYMIGLGIAVILAAILGPIGMNNAKQVLYTAPDSIYNLTAPNATYESYTFTHSMAKMGYDLIDYTFTFAILTIGVMAIIGGIYAKRFRSTDRDINLILEISIGLLIGSILLFQIGVKNALGEFSDTTVGLIILGGALAPFIASLWGIYYGIVRKSRKRKASRVIGYELV